MAERMEMENKRLKIENENQKARIMELENRVKYLEAENKRIVRQFQQSKCLKENFFFAKSKFRLYLKSNF